MRDAISYQTRVFNVSTKKELPPYFGRPSEAIDQAWHDLLECMFRTIIPSFSSANNLDANTRITAEELSHFPGREEQAIKLPDGGYLATMNAYHELHCIVSSTLTPRR